MRADYATLQRYAELHGTRPVTGSLSRELVQKVGLQIMAAYRLMRFFVEAGIPFLAQVTSRAVRHLYGSDIHWEAELAPGIMIVHGIGMAISDKARVATGAILFQHITLGNGTHPDTRQTGSPTIEEDVQIGPGATIIGPITIGARSRVAPGCLVRRSVPPDSVVWMPEPQVIARSDSHPRKSAGDV